MTKNTFIVGDSVSALLPYWVQVHDEVEPFVQAKVVAVSETTVTIEYDAHNTWAGKASLVVEDLDSLSKI